MGERTYTTFAEFWPFYLREHSRPATRRLHYVGTGLVIALAVVALASRNWWLLLALPVVGPYSSFCHHDARYRCW